MNAIMRKSVRGTAAGLGALAIIVGASACGTISDLAGGGDGGDDPAAEEPAEDEGAEGEGAEEEGAEGEGAGAEEDGAAEDAGGESSDGGAAGEETEGGEAGALSEEDLTAAGDQGLAFLKAAASGDGEGACAVVLDPTTGNGMSGSTLEACAAGFEGKAEEEGATFDPSAAEALDRSMIEATDNGDGTAGLTMMGTDAGVTMVKGEDGKWYVDSSAV